MVRKKRLCMFVVALLSIFMLSNVTAFATESDIPDATSQFYINDFANIISDDLEQQMQEKAVALSESTDGVQVVVTTVQTIGDADPVYYTVDMYNKYEIGKNNMGVLIMLSVETRDIQVRLGDNMTKYLSDRKSGEIIDEYGIPYFKNDQFAEGLYEMQNATIEYITSKVQSVENENAVTAPEDVGDKGFFRMILSFFTIICGGIASFLGLDKFLKKRKEKKVAEENARIENSKLVQQLKQKNASLQAELDSSRSYAERRVRIKDEEIKSLKAEITSIKMEQNKLQERYKRAIIAYPDLDEKVDSIFAQEKVEADKKTAFEVESKLNRIVELECTRQNLYQFENACYSFNNLSYEQQKYVPAELVDKVTMLCNKSRELQREFEEQERIRRNKDKAAEVQKLILGVLSYSVTRHALNNFVTVCNAYDSLTDEQKQYVTADIESLRIMRKKAQRLQDEYEEEERYRRQREEERRRQKQREDDERRRRMSHSSSRSSFGGRSHGGFGGRSGGHGAGRKF